MPNLSILLANCYKTLQIAGIEAGQKAAFRLWQQVSRSQFSRIALPKLIIMSFIMSIR